MDWEDLREELTTSSSRVAELLRAAPDGEASVPGLGWSVSELGAHLVSLPRRYQQMLSGDVPFPDSLSALNQTELQEIDSNDPTELADMLRSEVNELVAVLGDDGQRSVPFFGMEHTVAGVGGVLLSELLVHGLDLARALNRPWSMQPRQAMAATRGILPLVPYFVQDAAAVRSAGVYHLHLRGGDDWTIQVADGAVTVERSRPARADLHFSAEPVTNLLVAYKRTPRWRAALTLRIVVWGRKPWLATRFASLVAET